MNNTNIYKYRFDELLKVFKRNGKRLIENFGDSEDDMVVDICGNDFREYQRVISTNESWVIYAIEHIIIDLLSERGVEYSIPEYEEKSPTGRIRKIHPFSFAIQEFDKKVAYVFLFKQRKGLNEIRKNVKAFNDIDEIRFYFIQKKNSDQIEMLNDIEEKDDSAFLRFYILQELFDEKFGPEEFAIFQEYANDFNAKARNIIGFKMIAMPTPDTLDKFRRKKLEMLSSSQVVDSIKNIVSDAMFKIIKANYYGKNRFELLFGDGDYADSFLSSEWYYGIHSITGEMDQTGLVTGYLKSVEQLLYEILKLSWNKQKTRRIKINGLLKDSYPGAIYNNTYINFTQGDELYADKTLGSLIHFIKNKDRNGQFYNQDLFDVDSDTVQVLIDTLYGFKDRERNDHLHKDNVYTESEIIDIRDTALKLYVLILGCFKIEENELPILGMSSEDDERLSDEDLYKMITDWTTSVIKYDMPKKAKVVAFMLMKFQGRSWDLCIQGLSDIPEDKYDTIEWNHKMLFSSSITNNKLNWDLEVDWETGTAKVISILERYFAEDERSEELLSFSEIVLGNMNVIKVLKKDK